MGMPHRLGLKLAAGEVERGLAIGTAGIGAGLGEEIYVDRSHRTVSTMGYRRAGLNRQVMGGSHAHRKIMPRA